MRTSQIIVGTDGTASSRAAVEWAAREASRRRVPLRIVHVFDWEWASARYDAGSEYLDVARQLADAVTEMATSQARAVAPRISLETDALIGNPAPRLLEETENAALVVLGNRGRGDVTEGPIAVGVDDTDTADQVLRTAFQTAAERDTALIAVRTYLPPTPLWIGDVPATLMETPEEDAAEHAQIETLLAGWRQKYPQVPVEVMVSHHSAAAVLVGISHGAQLIIVGTHGHGAIASALLGSTGTQLLHHADCPVWIARTTKDGVS